jgi:hypothetical protein
MAVERAGQDEWPATRIRMEPLTNRPSRVPWRDRRAPPAAKGLTPALRWLWMRLR